MAKDPRQKGNIATLIPLIMILMMGSLYLYDILFGAINNLKYIAAKERLMVAQSNIVKSVIATLKGQKSCFTQAQVEGLLNIPNPSPTPIEFASLNTVRPCLADSTELLDDDEAKVTISRIPRSSDSEAASGAIKIEYDLRTGNSVLGVNSLHITTSRIIYFRIANLAEMGLVFRNNTRGPLIDLEGASSVAVNGAVYVHGMSRFDLQNLANPSVFANDPQTQFKGEVFFQTNQLTVPTESERLGSVLQKQFSAGLFNNQFSGMIAPFEVSPAAWDQDIDYHWVYSVKLGYPLPIFPNPLLTAAHDDTGFNPIDNTRARVLNFPNADVVDPLNLTCGSMLQYNRGDNKPMILYRAMKTVTLDLSSGRQFCGFVIADQLVINTLSGQNHLMIGSFWVNKLIIKGGGRVVIYNPFRSDLTPYSVMTELGMEPSFPSVTARQMISVRASTAYNFFLPLFRNQSNILNFDPLTLTHPTLMEPCSVGSNFMCWKPIIDVFKWDQLYSQSAWLKETYFFIEEGT